MNLVLGLLLSIATLVFFYFIFFKAYQLAFGKQFLKKLFTKKFTIAFGIVAFIGLLLVIFSISKNNNVYYWDYGGYWTSSYTYNDKIFTNPFGAVKSLGKSIWFDDYNLVLPLVISLPFRIIGFTYMRYTIINYLLFFIPMAIIAISLMAKISEKKDKKIHWGIPLFTVATFMYPFYPMLIGMIDIALLIPIFLLFSLALDFNPLETSKQNRKRNILIGILLVITFLFRRYSAFFCVGYIAALLFYTAWTLWLKRKTKNFKLLIKNTFFNYLTIGLTSGIILMTFFAPLVIRVLKNNYADMYSAYNLPLGDKLYSLVDRLGIIVIAVFVIGIIAAIIAKTKALTKMTIISLACLLITTWMFFRVQGMSPHHLYAIICPIMVIYFTGVSFILQQRFKIFKAFLITLLVAQPAYFFFGTVQRATQPVRLLFTTGHQPFARNDMPELGRLVDYLNSHDTGPIYVLASSGVLNSDILKSYKKPYTNNAIPKLMGTHDVDLRDGFPIRFLQAETVVVATPVQLHLPRGTQEVVSYLQEQIIDPESYIGDNFEMLDEEFHLKQDTTVHIYRKTTDFSEDDYDKMIDYYDSYYPTHTKLFGDRIKEYLSK